MREYFHDTQQQVLFTPAKDIVLCAGRGWGKGPIHAAINLRNMQRMPGSITGFVAGHSGITAARYSELMLRTGELVMDVGTMLDGKKAVKEKLIDQLGGISDDIHLISPTFIEPIQGLKTGYLGSKNPRLHTDEVLVALSICAVNDPTAETAMQQLEKLAHCEAHSSVILSHVDENVFKKLEVNITFEPRFQTKKLFHR